MSWCPPLPVSVSTAYDGDHPHRAHQVKRAHKVNRVSTGSRPRLARPGAVWLVLGSIATVQIGAAIAKHLFGLASPTGIVWLRLATAAVVLLLWSLSLIHISEPTRLGM